MGRSPGMLCLIDGDGNPCMKYANAKARVSPSFFTNYQNNHRSINKYEVKVYLIILFAMICAGDISSCFGSLNSTNFDVF